MDSEWCCKRSCKRFYQAYSIEFILTNSQILPRNGQILSKNYQKSKSWLSNSVYEQFGERIKTLKGPEPGLLSKLYLYPNVNLSITFLLWIIYSVQYNILEWRIYMNYMNFWSMQKNLLKRSAGIESIHIIILYQRL